MCPIQQTVYHGSDQVANPHSAKREPARTIDDALAEAELQYVEMVERLRGGEKLPQRIIGLVLTLAEKTPEDLVCDALASDRLAPRPGGSCPVGECSGTLDRYRTKRRGQRVIRYLKCRTCGATAKRVFPGAAVPRRQRPKGGT